jgi:hypothetical protein
VLRATCPNSTALRCTGSGRCPEVGAGDSPSQNREFGATTRSHGFSLLLPPGSLSRRFECFCVTLIFPLKRSSSEGGLILSISMAARVCELAGVTPIDRFGSVFVPRTIQAWRVL